MESNLGMTEVRLDDFTSLGDYESTVVWRVKDQSYVEMGDVVCEIDSGKASYDIEADEDGVISILVEGEVNFEEHKHLLLATIETPVDALVIR